MDAYFFRTESSRACNKKCWQEQAYVPCYLTYSVLGRKPHRAASFAHVHQVHIGSWGSTLSICSENHPDCLFCSEHFPGLHPGTAWPRPVLTFGDMKALTWREFLQEQVENDSEKRDLLSHYPVWWCFVLFFLKCPKDP